MGEPLHAYSSVRDALRILLDTHGEALGSRQITVSTVGLLGRLQQLGDDFGGRVQLALSLHAGTDATRQRIVPSAKQASLAQLRQMLLDTPRPKNRVFMIEYVLLPGVNDAEAEWDGVAAFVEGLPAIVNVIPFNPFPGAPFTPPTYEDIRRAWQALTSRGVRNAIRWPRGRDQQGACGQLMLTP